MKKLLKKAVMPIKKPVKKVSKKKVTNYNKLPSTVTSEELETLVEKPKINEVDKTKFKELADELTKDWEKYLDNKYGKVKSIKIKDPKYLGVPNICFSLTEGNDSREVKYSKQRIERGFDDSELWSLDCTIAKFVYPRLIRFREVGPKTGVPGDITLEQWETILDKMIAAFKIMSSGDCPPYLTEDGDKIVAEGFKLFGEWFFALWW